MFWRQGDSVALDGESSIISLSTAGFALLKSRNIIETRCIPSVGLRMTYMSEIGLSWLYPCQPMRPNNLLRTAGNLWLKCVKAVFHTFLGAKC